MIPTPHPRHDNLSPLSLDTGNIMGCKAVVVSSYLNHCLGTSHGSSLPSHRLQSPRSVSSPRHGEESWAQQGQPPWTHKAGPEVPSCPGDIFIHIFQLPSLKLKRCTSRLSKMQYWCNHWYSKVSLLPRSQTWEHLPVSLSGLTNGYE